MSNATDTALISTIKLRSARQNDTVLITDAFVLAALNDAQLKIVRELPRLVALDKQDTSTYQISTDDVSFDITTLNPAHIGGIWILNGSSTRRHGLKYRELSDFRRKYIPVASQSAAEPTEYTRQGGTIFFNRPVSSDYDSLFLHIDYTAFATALVNDGTASEIPDSDEGMILYGLYKVYDEIALSNPTLESKALKTRAIFNDWFDDYMSYQQMLIEEEYGANPW